MNAAKAAKAEAMIAAGQLTLPEIANRIGVGESTLRSWRREKRQSLSSDKQPSAPAERFS